MMMVVIEIVVPRDIKGGDGNSDSRTKCSHRVVKLPLEYDDRFIVGL